MVHKLKIFYVNCYCGIHSEGATPHFPLVVSKLGLSVQWAWTLIILEVGASQIFHYYHDFFWSHFFTNLSFVSPYNLAWDQPSFKTIFVWFSYYYSCLNSAIPLYCHFAIWTFPCSPKSLTRIIWKDFLLFLGNISNIFNCKETQTVITIMYWFCSVLNLFVKFQ